MNDNTSNAIVLCVFAGRIYDDNILKALKGGNMRIKIYIYWSYFQVNYFIVFIVDNSL